MKRASVVGVRAAIAAAVSAAVLVGVAVIWRGSQAIHIASEQVRAEHEFAITVQPYTPATNLGFEVVSSPQIFLQASRFQEHLFIAGPAGLPAYIVNALNTEIGKMLTSPELVAFLNNEGAEAEAMTPKQFSDMMRQETERWTRVAREADISID